MLVPECIKIAGVGETPYVHPIRYLSCLRVSFARSDAQNAIEDLHNLMLAANSDKFSDVSRTSEIAKMALGGDATNWAQYFGESNDDPQVWCRRHVSTGRVGLTVSSGLSLRCGR